MDIVAYALSKTYTKDSLVGVGAIKGSPCTIKETSYDVDGNTIVTFEWTATDNTKRTMTAIINKGRNGINGQDGKDGVDGKDGKDGVDGEQGEQGVSIVGAHFNTTGKIVFELSDGTETTPISLPSSSVDVSPDADNIVEQRANGIYAPKTDTSKFVEKEENKGLISDEEKTQITLNKNAIEVLNGDESTVGSVAKQIAEAIGKLNSLTKEIVTVVPSVSDAKENVIYLLKSESSTSYEMYSLVTLADGSKTMASLGSTEIDLDGYLTEAKAKELYLALTDIDKDTLSKLGTTTETVEDVEILYLTFNGSKIATLSQLENLFYKKADVDTKLDEKLDKSVVVKSLDATKTDNEVPSAKCVFDELEGKIPNSYGSTNKDKILETDEEGNVVLVEKSDYVNLDVGSDLNTLIAYGTYRTTTKRIDRIENVPVQVAGMLTVRLTGSIVYQTYNSIDNKMYTRTSEDTGTTWSDWKDVSVGGDEPFKGTEEEWDALSDDEKAKFQTVIFTDGDVTSKGYLKGELIDTSLYITIM